MMVGSSCGTLNAVHAMTTRMDTYICNDGRWSLIVGWVGSIRLVLQATHPVVTTLQGRQHTFSDRLYIGQHHSILVVFVHAGSRGRLVQHSSAPTPKGCVHTPLCMRWHVGGARTVVIMA